VELGIIYSYFLEFTGDSKYF